ncbi:two-partner secretion domain-containing protein [Pseudoduganella violacea]|uniref:Filamentous hemagglutinin n=1 Tax=Pseudoduganella violacea TaxID=1715466 RepID=A0A7W5FVR3_9BURK|nr:hemagglutinin repeat-containing protein [Pseudoduganella violacea]MBB3121280.1 filamentous hemagglutinin [Pseudoduganella violacea]
MNKLRYRLIFNKHRGQFMVVHELTRSHGKSPGEGTPAGELALEAWPWPALRSLGLSLLAAFGVLLCGSAMAQIIADPRAPGQQRATVLNTANGVLQVNVQTPSAAGVSRNSYVQFDVPSSGAVLNNSRVNVQSQIGGWVQANPWMAEGSARVILNEVNSNNASQIRGFLEVAGPRAEVVVANPAGIAVNGGGFINVSRATLTTGAPIVNDGRLDGYSVQRGLISIDGAGLDASRTDYTALIARAVALNGRLWAQQLQVTTGANQVKEAGGAALAQAGEGAAPGYAVDVAQLGGMYANKIFLVGTEKGVGVRNAGEIGAAAGDLVVTSEGRLENSGKLLATQQAQLAANTLGNSGTISGDAGLQLKTGALVNSGKINSAAQARIEVQGEIDNRQGSVQAQRLELSSGGALLNAQGKIVQTGATGLDIKSASLDNRNAGMLGMPVADGASGNAGTGNGTGNTGGTGSSGETGSNNNSNNGSANSGNNGNNGSNGTGTGTGPTPGTGAGQDGGNGKPVPPPLPSGVIRVAQALNNDGGTITAGGEVNLDTGNLDNAGGKLVLNSLSARGRDFSNRKGMLSVLRGVTIRSQQFSNEEGKLLAGGLFDAQLGSMLNGQGLLQAGQLALTAEQSLSNAQGVIRQTGTGAGQLSVAGQLNNDKGMFESAGNLDLAAGTLSSKTGKLNVLGDLRIKSGTASLEDGSVTVAGSATLRTAELQNAGGAISAGKDLSIDSAALGNQTGKLVAAATVRIHADGMLDNATGHIQSGQDMQLKASGSFDNHSGRLEALGTGSSLKLEAAAILNQSGQILNSGTGESSLFSQGALDNGGQIAVNGKLAATAQTVINATDASMTSAQDMALAVGRKLDNSGNIASGGKLGFQGSSAELRNGNTFLAQGDIRVEAGRVDNTAGRLATADGGTGSIQLHADELQNRAGLIQAQGKASLDLKNNLENAAGQIRSVGDMALMAGGRVNNDGGQLEVGGKDSGLQLSAEVVTNRSGRILNVGTGDSSILGRTEIVNNGTIGVNGQLSMTGMRFNNQQLGVVSTQGALQLEISHLLDNAGSISSVGMLNYHAAGASLLNHGRIVAEGGARFEIDYLSNDGAALAVTGAGRWLSAKVSGLSNIGGQITSAGGLGFNVAGAAINRKGVIQAQDGVQLKVGERLDNQDGAVEALGQSASLAVHSGSIGNDKGRIVNLGTGNSVVGADKEIINGGLIGAKNDLSVSAATVVNSVAGQISSSQALALTATVKLDNAGAISSGARLTLGQASADVVNRGSIVAAGDAAISAAHLDNRGGQIATVKDSKADMLLSAQNLSNQGGAIFTDRSARLKIGSDLDNSKGVIQAGQDLQVAAAGKLDNSAGVLEALGASGKIEVQAQSLENAAGRIVSLGQGASRVVAEADLHNAGLIASKGQLEVGAQTARNEQGATIAADGAMRLSVHGQLDNAGLINTQASLSMAEAGVTLNNSGQISAAGKVQLDGRHLNNDGGLIASAKGGGADLLLGGESLSNRQGKILADGQLGASFTGAVQNENGAMQGISGVALTAGGALGNKAGVIEAAGAGAALDVKARSITNETGRIVNVGSGAASVSAQEQLLNSGMVTGNGSLQVAAAALDNKMGAILASAGKMELAIGQRMDNAGTVNSKSTLTLSGPAASVSNGGQIVADGALAMRVDRLVNDGGQIATAKNSGADVSLQAQELSNRKGSIVADGSATLALSGGMENSQGLLQAVRDLKLTAAGAVVNNAGVMEATGAASTLQLQAGALESLDGRIVNVGSGDSKVSAEQSLVNSGLIGGNGALALAAGKLDNRSGGSISAATGMEMTVREAMLNAGLITSGGGFTLSAAGAGVGNSGQIVSGAKATLAAAALDNSGGKIVTLRDSGSAIALNAASIVNRNGQILADGGASLTVAGALDNSQGTLQAMHGLRISSGGLLSNIGGVIESSDAVNTLVLQAQAIDNGTGRIVNVGTGDTSISAQDYVRSNGLIAGNGQLSVQAQTLQQQAAGVLSGVGDVELGISQKLDNAGAISSGGQLRLDQAAAGVRNSGNMSARGPVLLHAADVSNDGGQIATLKGGGAHIVLDTGSLSNQGGNILADGNANVSASGNLNNNTGKLQAQGALTASAGATLSNNAGLIEIAGGAATLTVQGQAIVNAGGRIVNAGSGHTSLDAQTSLNNSGAIAGNGSLQIGAASLQNAAPGMISAGGALELAVRQQLDNLGGAISSGGTLNFNQAGASFSNSGKLISAAQATVIANTVNNDGGQIATVNNSGADIVLRGQSVSNRGGKVVADGRASLDSGSGLDNSGGTIHAGRDLDVAVASTLSNHGGTLEAAGAAARLDLRAVQIANGSGRIVNAGSGDTSVSSQGEISSSGQIAGNGQLILTAQSLRNQAGGSIGAGRDLELLVGQQLENQGKIDSNGKLNFNQAGASFSNSGQIASGGEATLIVASINNNGGKISTVKGSGADITLTGAFSNQGGSVLADGKGVYTVSGVLDNSKGTLQAGKDLQLSVSGALANAGGVIETLDTASTLTIGAEAIDNGTGRISNVGTGDTTLTSKGAISSNGAIAANGKLILDGKSLDNQAAGSIAAGKDLDLLLTEKLDNKGKINSGGTLSLKQANATFTNSGQVFAGGKAVIEARNVNNAGGQLGTATGSGADLTLTSQQLNNQDGRIATDRDLSVSTHTVQNAGEMFGGRDLALSMDGDYTQTSGSQRFHSNRDLSLTVTGNITNTATFEAAGKLSLSGNQVTNQAGASIQAQDLVLNAKGNIGNAGEINGQGKLELNSGATLDNTGGIVGGTVKVTVQNLNNTGNAALIGATNDLALGVTGTLNNTDTATLYSSGNLKIDGNGGSTALVNNDSSTIEAGRDLNITAGTIENVRHNVQVERVKTVDETREMHLPSWYQHGDNHERFEASSSNYAPYEVYYINPASILEEEKFVTPDGNLVGRVRFKTQANDSAFFAARSGLRSSYGQRRRINLSDGEQEMYYIWRSDNQLNPDQGGPAEGATQHTGTVTNWGGTTLDFSNQYGNCTSNCVRLVTQPDYLDPATTIQRDRVLALIPEKGKLERTRYAHHTAEEDRLLPGSGPAARIVAGGSANLSASAVNNRYAEILIAGDLVTTAANGVYNESVTLKREHKFDGTYRTGDGSTGVMEERAYSEEYAKIGATIKGKSVTINARNFTNVDVGAGTTGNLLDSIKVIGSGATGASSAAANAGASGANGGSAAGGQANGSGTVNNASGRGNAFGSGIANMLRTLSNAGSSGIQNQSQTGGNANGSGTAGHTGFASDVDGSGVKNGANTAGPASHSGYVNRMGADGRTAEGVAANVALGDIQARAGNSVANAAGAVRGESQQGNAVKIAPGGLFKRNPDASGNVLFETRPQFANHGNWISSDYLLKEIGNDHAITQKRLGDGFYEQRMVREQLVQAGRSLQGSGGDDSRYKDLLTSGISVAKQFDLRPGIALTSDQVSRLTSDIVWMESQTVELPDGSTENVLVPKVYLAHLDKDAVKPSGAVVRGDAIEINVSENIVNQGGVIDGGKGRTVLIAKQDIVNRGGAISGGDVTLQADRDVRNETLTTSRSYANSMASGSYTMLSDQAKIAAAGTLNIKAGQNVSDIGGQITAGSAVITAGKDVNFGTAQTGHTFKSQIGEYVRNESSITHVVSQLNASGNVNISADRNLSLSGTQLGFGGDGKLTANGNVNVASVSNETKLDMHNDASNKVYDKQIHENQMVVGSNVTAGKSLELKAGNATQTGTLNLTASNISGGDAVKLSATGSVNINEAMERHLSDTASHRESKSTFRGKATDTADFSDVNLAIGSSVSGKTVVIDSGKDLNVRGSAIAGEGDVNLSAAGKVDIAAATSTSTEKHHKKVTESGFLSGGGFGISYGTRTTTTDQERDATTQSGQSRSLIGSTGGNLTITAGEALKVGGSDLNAAKDMSLSGKSVTIDPGKDAEKGKFELTRVQDGLTLAIGGTVVDAIQAIQTANKATQTKNSRVQALAAATAAMQAANIANNVAQNGVNVSISLTAGHSESKQTQTTASLTNYGSALTAGNNLSITATGAGKDSNLSVIGSDLKAKGDIKLKADNAVNLVAAQDTESQHSDSKSMSAAAGIGASIGTNGMSFGFTASASLGRGKEDGEGTTQLNSYVTAGKQLTIDSGGDTTIKGAVASGEQVVAKVGGDLKLESLQDTAKFDAKNQSLSVSGTVGMGASFSASVNQSKIHSDYASVQEQSGIKAGDGGFQLKVGGNTDLKGAVISATAAGAASSILDTKTLTSSDIANHAVTKASSIGGGGTMGSAGSGDGKGAGPGGVNLMKTAGSKVDTPIAVASNDKNSSVTKSGVGAGQLVIRDDAAQIAATGKSAAQTVADLNRQVETGVDTSGKIANNFDKKEVETQLAVTAAFIQTAAPYAAKVVGDFAQEKQTAALLEQKDFAQKAMEAWTKGDTVAGDAYAAKAAEAGDAAAKWGDNGMYRVGLHTAAQGLIGGAASGGAGAVGSASAVVAGNQGQQIGKELGEAEAKRLGLDQTARDKLVNSYQEAFATVSGALSGLLTSGVTGQSGTNALASVTQSTNTARSVDVFNRQLHTKEIDLIGKLAKEKAKEVCRDKACEAKAEVIFSDALERTAKGWVDEKEYAKNQAYFQALLQASSHEDSNGMRGGLRDFLELQRLAEEMLTPHVGSTILVRGQPAKGDDAEQTYFSATSRQRADSSLNDVLGMQPPAPVVPGVEYRNKNRLEQFAVRNGNTEPIYPVEELLLGSAVGNRVTQTLGRMAQSLDVLLAGKVATSAAGNISARKVTEEGIALRLTSYEESLLAKMNTTSSYAVQGELREFVAESYFMRNGFARLEGKCGSGNCFDGVFIKGDTVYINEVKPLNANNSIKLSGPDAATGLKTQMSKSWVENAIQRLEQSSNAQAVETAKVINKAMAEGRLVKMVTGVDGKGMTLIKVE